MTTAVILLVKSTNNTYCVLCTVQYMHTVPTRRGLHWRCSGQLEDYLGAVRNNTKITSALSGTAQRLPLRCPEQHKDHLCAVRDNAEKM